jgi:hypothetical protein
MLLMEARDGETCEVGFGIVVEGSGLEEGSEEVGFAVGEVKPAGTGR